MATNTTARPDMSVDFMRWLNAELRKRVERPDDFDDHKRTKTMSFVDRLRAYLAGTSAVIASLSSQLFSL